MPADRGIGTRRHIAVIKWGARLMELTQPREERWFQKITDSLAAHLGRPRALKRYLALNRLPRLEITLPQPSADVGLAVMQWMHWSEGGYKPLLFLSPSHRVHGWYVDDQGRYRGDLFELPVLGRLVQQMPTQPWTCDIRDIDGIAASKGPIEDCATLDEFAESHCRTLIQEHTEENLMANWRHEGRFERSDGSYIMLRQFAWDDRTFWLNGGGSHHFAAARYLAGRLDRKLRVHGQLLRCELAQQPVAELLRQFYVLGMPTESYEAIFPQFEDYGVPHFWAKGPDPLGGRAVLLPRSETRAQMAAELLIEHGVFDLGAQLLADLRRQQSGR